MIGGTVKIYAELPVRRWLQVAADLFVALWTVIWVRLAMALHDVVQRLAGPGRTIETAGRRFEDAVGGAGAEAGEVPVVGEEVQGAFDEVAGAGTFLADAGQAQQDAVASLALWLAILVAVIPIALLIGRWLPWRLRWAVEATAARDIRCGTSGLQLFALRALASRSLYELRDVSRDPAADYARAEYDRLAELEFAALGLRKAAAPPRGDE
jgi:hypothetical protein